MILVNSKPKIIIGELESDKSEEDTPVHVNKIKGSVMPFSKSNPINMNFQQFTSSEFFDKIGDQSIKDQLSGIFLRLSEQLNK